MDEYRERASSITVPPNVGVEGFLRAIRGILVLPRVRSIQIDSRGKVQYTRFVRDNEPDSPLGVDYTDLQPWTVIRNGKIEEVNYEDGLPAPTVVAHLFDRVAQRGLVPIAIVTGQSSGFWDWHAQTAGLTLSRMSTAYGLPIYPDRDIPEYALIFCAAYVRGGSLVDCHHFFKVSMPTTALQLPETSVNIFPVSP